MNTKTKIKTNQPKPKYSTIQSLISILAQIIAVPSLIIGTLLHLAGGSDLVAFVAVIHYWPVLLLIWVVTAIIASMMDTLSKKLIAIFVLPPLLVLIIFYIFELFY